MEHPKGVLPHPFANNIQKLWIEGLLMLIVKVVSGWKLSLFFVLYPKQRMLFYFTWLELQLSVSQSTNIFYTKSMDEIPQMTILLPTPPPQKIGGKTTMSKLNPGKAVSPWFKTESSQALSHAIFVNDLPFGPQRSFDFCHSVLFYRDTFLSFQL